MKPKAMLERIFLLILFAVFVNTQTFAQVIDLQTLGADRWGRINPVAGFNAQSVGIGNFTGAVSPKAVLHVNSLLLPPSGTGQFTPGNLFRTDGTNSQSNVWSMWTGPTASTTTEKGAIFTNTNDFCMRASTTGGLGGDLVYYTNNTFERMRVKGGAGFDAGYVGINRRFPLSMLHIDGQTPSGNPNSTFAAGWRPWMRVGAFMQWDSDAIYVGLKDEGANRKDAVISWSDDGPAFGSDYLRFVYTNNNTAPVSQGGGPNGIEVGRWTPITGYFGIGDYYSSAFKDPAARLEILRDPNPGAPARMFRVTYTQQNPAAQTTTGVFTDMYTTSTGDYIILPTDNTQVNSANTFLQERRVGINTATPGNTVEINSQSLNANNPNAAGTSGLRFTDMRYGVSTPGAPSANQGVLSVNSNGDVVYIQAPGGFGAACGSPTQLTQETAVDLNGNMFHFAANVLDVNSKVGIGTSCGNSTRAKLIVRQHTVANAPSSGTMGVHVTNVDEAPSNRICYAIFAQCTPASPSFLDAGYTAGFFYAHGSKLNKGVDGFADGQASNGSANFGGYFSAVNGGTNVGVYAEAPHGVFPAPPSGVDWAIWAEGDILFNGTMTGTNNVTSDQMFKTNIDSISGALSLLNQIQPRTYYYDTANSYGMNFNSELQYGMIAQEVEPVMPELVSMVTRPARFDSLGNEISPAVSFKTLNYDAFIAILIAGMQEQQAQIDSLQSQISNCCSSSTRTQDPNTSVTDVTLSNSESVVLNQNTPNPFAEQTTITYFLPESAVKAQMLFYDAQGKLIKVVDLNGRGNGQLNVFADDLTNGIYSYALVVDGQVADTKQMVKTK